VATITRLAPEDLSKDTYRLPARSGDYDLVIFDRCGPEKEEDMPRSNTFFHRYPPPPLELKTLEKISKPANQGLDGQASGHALTWSPSREIGVAEAFKVPEIADRNRLIEIDQKNSLLFTRTRQSFNGTSSDFSHLYG